METQPHYEERAGHDFEQWMDWAGQADSITGPSESPSGQTNVNAFSPPESYGHDSSSTSPSLAKYSRPRSVDTALGLHNLPTPRHSSDSPEIPPLPELRLSGDTLRGDSPTRSLRPSLKRKLSPAEAITTIPRTDEDTKPQAKKRPHNVIEKRYRANLNEKIAELRDSVPSLRLAKRVGQDADRATLVEDDDLDGLTPTNKLNKASILTKAVEYIHHLELRNKKLDDENLALKKRLHTLDKVLASGGNSSARRAAAFTSDTTVENAATSQAGENSTKEESQTLYPPEGLIPVPESMRRLRADQPQEHYGHRYGSTQNATGGRKWPARLLLGSLAGLMIMEGFSESDQGSESKAKGLFGIPLELLDGYGFLSSPRVYLATFHQYCRAGGVLPLIKGFVALTVLAFFVFAYLFNSRPAIPPKETEAVTPTRAPSLASPIEVRRQAWLTSMQTLRLPHHHFFPELLAVAAEWLRYTIRVIFGESVYRWMTGRSGEDEMGRVKALDIAIDAQLAGGDAEVSRSRLVLTIFGSGLLPRTPSRLMLKALHCRVLLWKVGHADGLISGVANAVGVYLADRQWKAARQLHDDLDSNHSDALPSHLSSLLERPCEEVLENCVVQRAQNICYGLPTSAGAEVEDSMMDVVVEDHAIGSPLDAVAAWWSSRVLRNALMRSLEVDTATDLAFRQDVKLATDVAPPFSTAHTRALAIHAAFFAHNRAYNQQLVLNALPKSVDELNPTPNPIPGSCFIDSSTPESAVPELITVLRCANAMHSLRIEDSGGTRTGIDDAVDTFSRLLLHNPTMSLLGFAPAYHVLQAISSPVDQIVLSRACVGTLSQLHAWSSRAIPDMKSVLAAIEELRCTMQDPHHKRRRSDMSNDTGYASLDDGEAV